MAHWIGMAASRRGVAHARRGEVRQDAVSVATSGECGDRIVFVLADGAGSASHGRQGATLACRSIMGRILASRRSSSGAPSEEMAWDWMDAARDAIGRAAARKGLDRRAFACTLIAVVAGPEEIFVAHVGDGGVVARPSGDSRWVSLSWPEGGEYAGTTHFLTDDPAPRLRVHAAAGDFDAVAAFTDGIERLVLDFASSAPHSPFFERMTQALDRVADDAGSAGFQKRLSQRLGDYLGGESVNARTDDDKTLAIAVRFAAPSPRPLTPGALDG